MSLRRSDRSKLSETFFNKQVYGRKDDFIIGHVEYHHEYYSRFCKNERDIIVWLPPSYYQGHKRYPVLYMHDGQNLFDPSTSFIGQDWKVDEVTTDLIYKKEIDEIIVVGIYNTIDRISEYNLETSNGKKYKNFIVQELKPFIDDNYHTIIDSKNTALMGSSMGGLISFQLVWNYPQIFSKCACLSSSFWITEKRIFQQILQDKGNVKDISLYLDYGSLEKELIEDNEEMFELLKNMGYEKTDKLLTHVENDAEHSEIDWAARLNIPLKF